MKIIFLFLTILISVKAWSWGVIGHRVVGEIAQRHLNPKAQRELKKIDPKFSLARISTWPDEIRSEPEKYSYTFNWHYTDWPDDHADHDHDSSTGTLLKAIENSLLTLKNKKGKIADREFALKFLVHLVGDLHMPLHVGNGLDRGGNDCKVSFHGMPTNLHRLWDDDMLNFTRLSYTELSDFLDILDDHEIRKIQTATPLEWARESKNLRASLYPKPVVVQTNLKQKYSVTNYCVRGNDLPQNLLPNLGYEYSYQFIPVVEMRLTQAGLRLAYLLNQIF